MCRPPTASRLHWARRPARSGVLTTRVHAGAALAAGEEGCTNLQMGGALRLPAKAIAKKVESFAKRMGFERKLQAKPGEKTSQYTVKVGPCRGATHCNSANGALH